MPEQLMQPRPLLMVDAVDHQVEVLLPVVDLVVAQQDLAEAGAVGLHARVALVLLDGRRAAEDQAARAVLQHRGADVARRRDRCAMASLGDAGLEERLRHAIRRPRLLRAGLEHQADLQRDDRQPERVHAGRVRRQHHAQHRRCAW